MSEEVERGCSSGRSARFDHVVTVMLENRSFDNLLGHLYESGEAASFEGVIGKDLSNPIPSYAPGAERGVEVRAMNREPPHPDAMLALAGLLYKGLLALRGQPARPLPTTGRGPRTLLRGT